VNVTINTSGVTALGPYTGYSTPLASLTTDAGGSTQVYGTVYTVGGQSYGDAVVLTGATQMIAGAGSTVRFGSTVDSLNPAAAQQLVVSGNARFEQAVGATGKLASVNVSGTTAFAG